MTWGNSERIARRYRAAQDDQRQPFERDRDRILYSSALRRLTGVSQVVRAGEADVFHNRLAHTLKVSQIGRRLAQRRLDQQGVLCNELGVDAEVVEAASLAHDLGHPPFGHPGEEVLNELVMANGETDGYEGNAQSFRIVTTLAVRFENCNGLDLTRATLTAIMKYPWMREASGDKSKKWAAYSSEQEDFDFARRDLPEDFKTAEAELMDWADDIAYSVHDLEDFHRCQVIPWHQFSSTEATTPLIDHALSTWRSAPADARSRLESAFARVMGLIQTLVPQIISEPYEGTREQRRQVRFLTSQLIGRYIHAIALKRPEAPGAPCVEISRNEQDEVLILKQLTRDFAISSPALAAQQKGQRRILEELFTDLLEDVSSKKSRYIPTRFQHLVRSDGVTAARVVADCVSSLTEAEAVALHRRLRGHFTGSVLDPIVR